MYWRLKGRDVLRMVREAARDNTLLRDYDLRQFDPHYQGRGLGRDLVSLLEKALP